MKRNGINFFTQRCDKILMMNLRGTETLVEEISVQYDPTDLCSHVCINNEKSVDEYTLNCQLT